MFGPSAIKQMWQDILCMDLLREATAEIARQHTSDVLGGYRNWALGVPKDFLEGGAEYSCMSTAMKVLQGPGTKPDQKLLTDGNTER